MGKFYITVLLGLLAAGGTFAQRICQSARDFQCPSLNGVFPASGENKCHHYFHCVLGFAIGRSCYGDEVFDLTTTTCTSPVYDQQSDAASDLGTLQLAPFACPDNGFFAKENCSEEYYSCTGCPQNCTAFEISCKHGEKFDQETLRCIPAINHERSEVTIDAPYVCPDNGFYAKENCSKDYYSCSGCPQNCTAFEIMCPVGTFNPDTHLCAINNPYCPTTEAPTTTTELTDPSTTSTTTELTETPTTTELTETPTTTELTSPSTTTELTSPSATTELTETPTTTELTSPSTTTEITDPSTTTELTETPTTTELTSPSTTTELTETPTTTDLTETPTTTELTSPLTTTELTETPTTTELTSPSTTTEITSPSTTTEITDPSTTTELTEPPTTTELTNPSTTTELTETPTTTEFTDPSNTTELTSPSTTTELTDPSTTTESTIPSTYETTVAPFRCVANGVFGTGTCSPFYYICSGCPLSCEAYLLECPAGSLFDPELVSCSFNNPSCFPNWSD